WGEQYNRKLADLLAIQEQLGREIAEQLRLRLTGQQKKELGRHQPQNPEAYQEYLKGRYFANKQTAASIQTATEYYQKAIAKDPGYGLAYAGLADSYMGISFFSAVPPRKSFPKAQAAARKALQLGDTLAEPHTTLAFYKMIYEWDWAGAEAEFRRALQLDPGYARGHQWYSYYLEAVGRFEEAIQEAKRAQELDPVSLIITTGLGIAYEHAQRYDQAMEQYRKVLAMDPNFVRARLGLGLVYILKSMYIEAIAETQTAVKLAPADPPAISYLGLAYARSGDRVAARKVLDNMMAERSRRGYFPDSWIALVHLGLGDDDRAFEWLGKAVEEHDPWLIYIKRPLWDPLRSDPRYTDLLRRMNLAP
ncbi:MAG: tetratricopeptide repeat protein, partial [Acidobacteria bacterium]|nr:tetratricopeptide repeat protein [Acidobacteriota bacterium]